ncbi:50S ribosomal protein L29 [Patescibacteria group bacterium]|nr:50S ribosomal protein L29 [Patescibacteria group bacterium]
MRQKPNDELRLLLKEHRQKLEHERFLAKEGKAKNVKSVKLIRKDIARMLTLLRENKFIAKS